MISDFGVLLKEYRKKYKITQVELGDIMICTRVTINKIEHTSDIKDLSNDSLFRIYHFLSTTEHRDGTGLGGYLLNNINDEIMDRIDSRLDERKHNK